MSICNTHSHDLLKVIKDKGMVEHISLTKEQAVIKAKRWLQGNATKEQFDPYVVASLEIYQKANEQLGLIEDPVCPLCVVEQVLGASHSWIDNVTDLLVLFCRTNDLPLRS